MWWWYPTSFESFWRPKLFFWFDGWKLWIFTFQAELSFGWLLREKVLALTLWSFTPWIIMWWFDSLYIVLVVMFSRQEIVFLAKHSDRVQCKFRWWFHIVTLSIAYILERTAFHDFQLRLDLLTTASTWLLPRRCLYQVVILHNSFLFLFQRRPERLRILSVAD